MLTSETKRDLAFRLGLTLGEVRWVVLLQTSGGEP